MSENRYSLTKGEVMMYLNEAGLRRAQAAELAGVSKQCFFRLMRVYRVKAPKAHAKLNEKRVALIRALLGKHPRDLIARALGLHVRTIDQVATYATWYQVAP